MYMPLCRECHARETKFNDSGYSGDPTDIRVKEENEAQGKGSITPDSPNHSATTASMSEHDGTKSFSEDIESADELQLRKKNSEPLVTSPTMQASL